MHVCKVTFKKARSINYHNECSNDTDSTIVQNRAADLIVAGNCKHLRFSQL